MGNLCSGAPRVEDGVVQDNVKCASAPTTTVVVSPAHPLSTSPSMAITSDPAGSEVPEGRSGSTNQGSGGIASDDGKDSSRAIKPEAAQDDAQNAVISIIEQDTTPPLTTAEGHLAAAPLPEQPSSVSTGLPLLVTPAVEIAPAMDGSGASPVDATPGGEQDTPRAMPQSPRPASTASIRGHPPTDGLQSEDSPMPSAPQAAPTAGTEPLANATEADDVAADAMRGEGQAPQAPPSHDTLTVEDRPQEQQQEQQPSGSCAATAPPPGDGSGADTARSLQPEIGAAGNAAEEEPALEAGPSMAGAAGGQEATFFEEGEV